MKPILFGLLVLIQFSQMASASSWGPWSTSQDAPAMRSVVDRSQSVRTADDPAVPSVAATPFLWLLRFYQTSITQIDGDRCVMHPTCSTYSVIAIRKHGPVIGIIMTSDRLIHEFDEQMFVPQIKVGNRWRFDDPVGNNDFWWAEK